MLYTLLGDWIGILQQLEFRILAAFGVAFVAVMVLGERTIRALIRLKVGDAGATDAEALRVMAASKANIPSMGGVLVLGAILLATLLLADITEFYVYAAMIVLLAYGAIGGADDFLKLTASWRGARSRQGLYSWEKLAFQLGLALVVSIFLYRHGATGADRDLMHVLNLPFQKTYIKPEMRPNSSLLYLPPWVFVPLCVAMIAGMSNAVNITDGMDGLASGLAVIVSVGLVVLAGVAGTQSWAQYLLVPYIPAAEELAVVAGAMGGATLGFLWFNCSPARVFMGDTGSLALGALIGFIAIVIRQEVVIALMCGVYVLEITSVVLQVGWFKYTRIRTGEGRRIFRVAPYHHHLHLGNWPEQRVVARLWIVGVLLLVVALASIKVR
ncbi:MAG: phospho-N-acetylmuramoyl-pentapeptide-transferase [Phycisphaerales bacterium]|jgi:phospho-N-acetylmuramoyl-pentapeptide-transferase|nr:phospho-N-acetylmuramoyl-pentapeptide-transferase [Phycisphaerales bacterium]